MGHAPEQAISSPLPQPAAGLPGIARMLTLMLARNSDGSPAAKRTRREQQRQQRKELRRQRKEYYERGTFWGKPAAFILWELTHQLQLENSNQLW